MDFIKITYSTASDTAQHLLFDADELDRILQNLWNVTDSLRSGAFEGAFHQDFELRWETLASSLYAFAERTYDSGEDLNAAVEQYRALDADCARLFDGGLNAAVGTGTQSGAATTAPVRYDDFPESGKDGCLTGDYEHADVIYVNGILTNFDGHEGGRNEIQGYWGDKKVAGIYNATEGPFGDIGQSIGDVMQGQWGVRLGGSNPAVTSLVEYVKRNQGRPLELIGYSQGSATVSAALNILQREGINLSNVTVTTFGGAGIKFPAGSNTPQYRHFLFEDDPILPVAALDVLDGHVNTQRISLGQGSGYPGGAHALSSYLAAYNQYQQGRVGQTAGGGGSVGGW